MTVDMQKNVMTQNAEEIKIKLQDLSRELKEVVTDRVGCFYKYRSSREIGGKIYRDFIKYNQKRTKKSINKFIFSEDIPSSGILSQLHALQTINTLIRDFDIEEADDCFDIIFALLDDILGEISKERKDDGGAVDYSEVTGDDGSVYNLSASPYLPGSDIFSTHPYVDTITWVMSGVLSIERLYLAGKINELPPDKYKKICSLYKYCINFLNKNFIAGSGKSDRLDCGWNYTSQCEEPSLYFTFAVSEVLIDIVDTFDDIIRVSEAEEVNRKIDEAHEEALARLQESDCDYAEKEAEIKRLAEEFTAKKMQNVKKNIDHIRFFEPDFDGIDVNTAEIVNNTRSEQADIYAKTFLALNAGKLPHEKDSPYAELERHAKSAAVNVYSAVGDAISTEFFSSDLMNKVSVGTIEQSLTSDALFNTIFAINIMVNAGLDEDMERKIDFFTVAGSTENMTATDEYDDLRGNLQSGYDYTYLTYRRLDKSNKEYKVNEFTLTFGENFKVRAEEVKDLRKARIRVFSLMPLLVKTKTLLSEFLIRYPQYDMMLYLETILKSRYIDSNGQAMWLWEREGYSSASNYYFVNALSCFYRYYTEYEEKYEENALDNEEARSRVKRDYLEELRNSTGEIGLLKSAVNARDAKIELLDKRIAELEAEVEELNNDSLKKALGDLILKVITDKITVVMSSMLEGLTKGMTCDIFDDTPKTAEQIKLENSAKDAVLAILSTRIYQQIQEEYERQAGGKKNVLAATVENKEFMNAQYREALTKIPEDVGHIVDSYIRQVVSGDSSELARSKCLEGFGEMKQHYNAQKNKQ